MTYNKPLILRVASNKDFVIPVRLLFLLVVFSALLSPQPVLLTLLVILLPGAGWLARILGFFKVDTIELTLVIFPDRRVRLESNCEDTIEGFLEDQQWCTHRAAVLRMASEGTARKLLILAVQQQAVDDFRRLNMWLRQDFCSDTEDKQMSGISPWGRV